MTDKTKKNAYLVSYADYKDISSILKYKKDEDVLIAVDGGANLLYKSQFMPDLIVGDLDSIKPEVREFYKNKSTSKIYSSHKDETDTELALKWCLENGLNEIILINSFQGRFDQVLGLVSNILYAKKNNMKLVVKSSNTEAFLLPKVFIYDNLYPCYISLLPISEEVTGVYTENLFYPLKNETLYNFQTRGLSNFSNEKIVKICHENGNLLVIITRKDINE